MLIAVGLKYHYSHARSDDLAWILSPTAGMVEYMSGIQFEKEAGAGFVNHEYRTIIAPSCAGVNFLIIAFCMAVFSGLHHLRSNRLKAFWLGHSAVCAYLLTIAVNTFRIVTSIYTFEFEVHHGWLTPERFHRVEGVFIYFFFLCLYYLALEKIIRHSSWDGERKKKLIDSNRDAVRIIHAAFIPLFWYIFISLGVPLLNRAYLKNGPRFVEHGVVMLSVCMVVFLFLFLIQVGFRWISFLILKFVLFLSKNQITKHKRQTNLNDQKTNDEQLIWSL
jgi:exosortase K